MVQVSYLNVVQEEENKGGEIVMGKSVEELKGAGTPARTLADLKKIDTSPFIKLIKKTAMIDGNLCTIEGQYEPIVGTLVKFDWREQSFKSKTPGQPDDVRTMFDWFISQNGRVRPHSSASEPLRRAMIAVIEHKGAVGKKISIQRTGESKETKYTVEVLDA